MASELWHSQRFCCQQLTHVLRCQQRTRVLHPAVLSPTPTACQLLPPVATCKHCNHRPGGRWAATNSSICALVPKSPPYLRAELSEHVNDRNRCRRVEGYQTESELARCF